MKVMKLKRKKAKGMKIRNGKLKEEKKWVVLVL